MTSRIHHSKSDPKVMSFKGKAKNELVVEEDGYEDEEEAIGLVGCGEDDKKKKPMIRRGSNGSGGAAAAGSGGGGGVAPPCCQAEKCTFDLSDAKRYYRRHKVCEQHSKAPIVIVAGLRQRFCQQCSRFHELSEFDEAKRSCRRRLAGHNERRRKSSAESHGEGSSDKGADPLKESHCRPANQNGRIPMTISGHAKHFQIR